MEFDALVYTDFISPVSRQPSAAHEAAQAPDPAALAEAERADAIAFRLV